MTQEHKELLLKDLCSRMPYKVIVDYGYNAFNVHKGSYVERGTKCILNCYLLDVFISPRQNEKGEYIKPYLFPMSNMTEEQKKEYHSLCIEEEREQREFGEWVTRVYYHNTIESIDWLNAHHFDYRGLIPMGLANDATELNIY